MSNGAKEFLSGDHVDRPPTRSTYDLVKVAEIRWMTDKQDRMSLTLVAYVQK